ncbi:MAG: OmpA family protein, partial [Shimia sp.]
MVGAFALAGALAYGAGTVAVGWLERASQTGVERQMRLTGFDWAEVQADGLQVVLSGEAPSEVLRFNALSAASTVVDAARVIDNLSVEDTQNLEPPRFSVEVLRNDAGISLIGLIPASLDREAIMEQVAAIAEDGTVTDLLEVADHPAPTGFRPALDYAMRVLEELPRAQISVETGRVDVRANADSPEQKAQLQARLSRRAPDDVRTAIDITTPRPVITPFTLRFVVDGDGPRFDSCSVATPRGQTVILEAAATAGLEGKAECRLGLGAPSGDWPQAASAAIAAVNALGEGTVTFRDTDVSLIAIEGTPQQVFDDAVADLERALPDVYALTAVLPVPEVETEEGPPVFTATLSPEGELQARGVIADALSREAMETFSQAAFGSDAVYVVGEEREVVPAGWSVRTLAGLAALGELSNGSVEVTADQIALRGQTGNPNARAEIAQLLSQRLGEGEAFSLSVEYLERLDPAANILTAEECVQRINDAKQGQLLTFEPGSAQLSADSRSTIEAIAEVLRECADPAIEVAGHTDSQGREEMNLELSQARAEAVVTALREER